jgi:hypothetical protein
MAPRVASKLEGVCQVQWIIGNDAAGEAFCWNVSSASPFGQHISFDVIHFNEGLHSLWPRVNSTEALATWAEQLADFTRLIQATQPSATLVYGTMTPYMPEKFDDRPSAARFDQEEKNALAVATVLSSGVKRIHDLYKVVTDRCGTIYKDCSICDDESRHHPSCPDVKCGYHYTREGWDLLAESTANTIVAALQDRALAGVLRALQ